jgi:hypothetical protein
MKPEKHNAAVFLISYVVLAAVYVPVASCADKKVVLQQANQAYYNLRDNGLVEFSCQVLPDWDSAFRGWKLDAVGQEQVLPTLKQMHFRVTVGPNGGSFDFAPIRRCPANRGACGTNSQSRGRD